MMRDSGVCAAERPLQADVAHDGGDDQATVEPPARVQILCQRPERRVSVNELAARGKAVLMVSSYLPELFGVCHSLAVMSRGRLSPARPIDEWTPETVMEAAVGG